MEKTKELEKVIENIKEKNLTEVRKNLTKWAIKDFITRGIPIGFIIGIIALIPFYIFKYNITLINHIEILTFSTLFYAILRAIFLETKEEQIVSLAYNIEKITRKKEIKLDEEEIEKIALHKQLTMSMRNSYLVSFTFFTDIAIIKFLTS